MKGKAARFPMTGVVHVNIWDDYRQRPEYDENDATCIIIDTPLWENDEKCLREKIYAFCKKWEKTHAPARFYRFYVTNKIIAVELDAPLRNQLLADLQASGIALDGLEVRFHSES